MTNYLPGFKQTGSGPLLVFLHGLGGNRHAFDRQTAVLSSHYTCVSWDVPGYGDSQALPELSFPVLSQCLDNLLTHLGQVPHAVVGHSLGGMVVQNWLARGGQCQKIVLAQTSARFGKPGSQWNEDFLASRLKPIDEGLSPADFARTLIVGMFHDPDKTERIEEGVATMSTITPNVYRSVIQCLVTFDEMDNLANISADVLCLAGEHDTTAPPKAMAQMAQTIPDARYVCLPNTGHLGYLEAADDFTQTLINFLEAA